MTDATIAADHQLPMIPGIDKLSLLDLKAMRLILEGSSVMDWLHFPLKERADIQRLLSLNEFSLDDPEDKEHLADLAREALLYLTEIHRYRLPPEIQHNDNIISLLDWATGLAPASPVLQTHACIVLKVTHVLHYLSARELLFRLPISEQELNHRLSAKVFDAIERMRSSRVNLVEFSSGQKSRTSMLTKLLVRPETQAYQVFDRMRCRVVVESRADILPAIHFLMHNLFPFNYISPCESLNSLIDTDRLHPERLDDGPSQAPQPVQVNEFSGPTYRSINFIAAVPLRVDDVLTSMDHPPDQVLGRVIFAQTEFQLLDRATANNNDLGDNSHQAYKRRQLGRVRQRLEAGAAAAGITLERDQPEE